MDRPKFPEWYEAKYHQSASGTDGELIDQWVARLANGLIEYVEEQVDEYLRRAVDDGLNDQPRKQT